VAHLLAGEDERAEGDGVGPEAGFQQLLGDKCQHTEVTRGAPSRRRR
jgi:hypothetical protein